MEAERFNIADELENVFMARKLVIILIKDTLRKNKSSKSSRTFIMQPFNEIFLV